MMSEIYLSSEYYCYLYSREVNYDKRVIIILGGFKDVEIDYPGKQKMLLIAKQERKQNKHTYTPDPTIAFMCLF